tara:strand:- start:454 stop:1668 length:1215 start_codon:yes stop_codon:yes gene_type:complete
VKPVSSDRCCDERGRISSGENCNSIRKHLGENVYRVQERTCDPGTDCIDCGGICLDLPYYNIPPQPPSYCEGDHVCENNSSKCLYVNDGHCDDGGLGSEFSECDLGFDCGDCGKRCNYAESCIHYNISTYNLNSVPIGWSGNTNVIFFNNISEHNDHYLFFNNVLPPVIHNNKFFSISSNILTENMLGETRAFEERISEEECKNLATLNNGTYTADVNSCINNGRICFCSVDNNNTWDYFAFQADTFPENCYYNCYVLSSNDSPNYNKNNITKSGNWKCCIIDEEIKNDVYIKTDKFLIPTGTNYLRVKGTYSIDGGVSIDKDSENYLTLSLSSINGTVYSDYYFKDSINNHYFRFPNEQFVSRTQELYTSTKTNKLVKSYMTFESVEFLNSQFKVLEPNNNCL